MKDALCWKTNLLCKHTMTQEEKIAWIESIARSPYYTVACEILRRSPKDDPNEADLFEAFHKIAKVDHKINKRED